MMDNDINEEEKEKEIKEEPNIVTFILGGEGHPVNEDDEVI